jgi:hypothetical protein
VEEKMKRRRAARIGQAAGVVIAVGLASVAPARAFPPVKLLNGTVGCSMADDARNLQEAIVAAKETSVDSGGGGSCRDLAGYWARIVGISDKLVLATVTSDRLELDPKRLWIPISFVAKAAAKQGLIKRKP